MSVNAHGVSNDEQYVYETLTLTANAADQKLSARLIGGYLFTVEIFTSDDDAVTFQIKTALGTSLVNHTTSAATSGEFATINDRYAINGQPTYTLSNFSGTGTVTVEITVAKR